MERLNDYFYPVIADPDPVDTRRDFLLMGKNNSFMAAQNIRHAGYHPLRHVPNTTKKMEIFNLSPFFFHAPPSYEPRRHTSNAWVTMPP